MDTEKSILLVPEGSLYLAFRLPRLLKRAGYEVDVLSLKGDILATSRYVRDFLAVDTSVALTERMAEVIRDPGRKWRTVIVAHEYQMRRMIDACHQKDLVGWQPGLSDPVVGSFYKSKFGLVDALNNWGIRIPPCRICHSLEEVVCFGRKTGWPIMIKPSDMSGGTGVIKLSSEAEVMNTRCEFPLFAQKFVRGKEGVAEMVCARGYPLAILTSYVLQRSCVYGPSMARRFERMPRLDPMVKQVAALTRFEGFCGFDWIEEEGTGEHYLIEFHPRATSGFRFGRFCGVNIEDAIRAWINGDSTETPPCVQTTGPMSAHYFPSDLMYGLRHRLWKRLFNWVPRKGVCYDVFWDDWSLLFSWARRGKI